MKLRESLQLQHTQESAIFVVGMVLRCWQINAAPFWYDEAYSALLARLPLYRMVAATASDVHPPLYYFLLSTYAWIVGGFTPFLLRQLSAILGIYTIIQVARLASRFELGRISRAVLLILVATSPVLIFYSQETRMYALLNVLVLEAWIQIMDRRWWAVGLLLVGMLYTHNYGVLYAASLGLVAFLRAISRPREIYRVGEGELKGTDIPAVLITWALAALAYLPWLLYSTLGQLDAIKTNYWTSTINLSSNILGTVGMLAGIRNHATIVIIIAMLVIGLAPWAIYHTLKAQHASWVIMAVGPIALAAALCLWRPVYLSRGIVPALPAWYLITVLMLRRAVQSASLLSSALSLLLIICLGAGLFTYIGMTDAGLQKFNPMQPSTMYPTKPGVPVIHTGDFSLVNWLANRPEVASYYIHTSCPEMAGALSLATRAALRLPQLQADQLPKEYYLVLYVGIMSTQCDVDAYNALKANSVQIYSDPWQYGEGGIYYHAQ